MFVQHCFAFQMMSFCLLRCVVLSFLVEFFLCVLFFDLCSSLEDFFHALFVFQCALASFLLEPKAKDELLQSDKNSGRKTL